MTTHTHDGVEHTHEEPEADLETRLGVTPTHIYVSGPMRNRDGFNFPAFFEAEAALRERWPGADICNPAREDVVRFGLHSLLAEDPSGLKAGRHLKDTAEFGEAELRDALGRDLAYICQHANLLVMLDGWRESTGANSEAATATALGVTVVEWTQLAPALERERMAQDTEEDLQEAPGGDSVAPAMRSGDEVRVTSASGGQKGTKLAAFDQISPEVEWLVAEHFGKGARKYDAHNFRKGYPWSLSYSALRRHLADFWAGKEYDVCSERCEFLGEYGDEGHGPTCRNHTGSLHIVCAIWHTMVLTEFFIHRKEYDDRYVYTSEA